MRVLPPLRMPMTVGVLATHIKRVKHFSKRMSQDPAR